MSRHAPKTRHQASHDLDGWCAAMMGIVVEMMDAAFIIGAQDKLVAAREAIDGLHKAATAAHDTAIREMK